jgi:hypothetical protein
MNYVAHAFTLMFGLGVGIRMALPYAPTNTTAPIQVTENELFAVHLNCITPSQSEGSPGYYECFHAGVWTKVESKMR